MLSEQIRGIANHIIVGMFIDNKIIRLLYTIANEVEKIEDNLDRAEGERMIFGERIVELQVELMSLKSAYYRARNKSFALEEENERLFAKEEALNILLEDAGGISLQGKLRMITIGLGAWKRAIDLIKEK